MQPRRSRSFLARSLARLALPWLAPLGLAACTSGSSDLPTAHEGGADPSASSDGSDGRARDGGGLPDRDSSVAQASEGGPDGDGTPGDAGSAPSGCVRGGAGNPFVDGFYADPDLRVYDGVFWVYPTYSAPYDAQTYLDAFSSTDLVHWQKHEHVLERRDVTWATRAIWAPSPIARGGKYYLYFGANDIQNDDQLGGIGVAVADAPGGPYVDALGAPLIGAFHNGAQPIDQNVFLDDDGQAYLYYGGWGHCNVVKLNEDMVSLGRHDDGTTFKEITPQGYVEGALMFKRNGTYYFMWSEGGWTGPDYRVSYAMASSPLGPFERLGTILGQNAAIGTGAGHNTVVNVPGTDEWYIFYHRHPLGDGDGNHRVLAYDRLSFRSDGTIAPVVMTSHDDFCDDNALGWTTQGGDFVVRDQGYEVSPNGEAKALMNTNYAALDARVQVTTSGRAGLLFRASNVGPGANDYRGYVATLDSDGDQLVLGRGDGDGSFTVLARGGRPLDATDPHELRVVASGSRLDMFLDGEASPVLSASDATYASGMTGLVASSAPARFDDVDVVAPPGAIFYGDGNYGGPALSLADGAYRLAQLEAAGMANDAVSSLRVPAGWTVQLFADDGFAGASWTFTSDTPLLPVEANDTMSSVRITAP